MALTLPEVEDGSRMYFCLRPIVPARQCSVELSMFYLCRVWVEGDSHALRTDALRKCAPCIVLREK